MALDFLYIVDINAPFWDPVPLSVGYAHDEVPQLPLRTYNFIGVNVDAASIIGMRFCEWLPN